MVGTTLVCIWVSEVEVPSLGLLLGRDFLESVGAHMSFADHAIVFEFLKSQALALKQLAAGHYMLQLVPSRWEGVGTQQKWRKLGVDGVCEVQLSVRQRLKVKLAASKAAKKFEHEHYLTESSVRASRVAHGLAERHPCSLVQTSRPMSPGAKAPTSTTSPSTTSPSSSITSAADDVRRNLPSKGRDPEPRSRWRSRRSSGSSLESPGRKTRCPAKLALVGCLALACAASINAVCASAVPVHRRGAIKQWKLQAENMELAGVLPKGTVMKATLHGNFTSQAMADCIWLRNRVGLRLAFLDNPVLTGMLAAKSAKGLTARVKSAAIEEAKQQAAEARAAGPCLDRSSRWPSNSSRRFGQVGSVAQHSREREDDRAPDQSRLEAHSRVVESKTKSGFIIDEPGGTINTAQTDFGANDHEGKGETASRCHHTPLAAPMCAGGLASSASGGPTLHAPQRLEQQIQRARALDKRPADVGTEELRSQATEQAPFERPAQEPSHFNDTLVVSKEDILSILEKGDDVHPLVKLYCEACVDRANPLDAQVHDHGAWDGRWGLPSRSEWKARESLGLMWPCGRDDNEALAVQAARKEYYYWRAMTPEQKIAYCGAAETGWSVWVTKDAVEVLDENASKKIRAELKNKREDCKILTPRWVFTDKRDGLRAKENNLGIKPSARLVVPGFKDVLSFSLREDAPTASRWPSTLCSPTQPLSLTSMVGG